MQYIIAHLGSNQQSLSNSRRRKKELTYLGGNPNFNSFNFIQLGKDRAEREDSNKAHSHKIQLSSMISPKKRGEKSE